MWRGINYVFNHSLKIQAAVYIKRDCGLINLGTDQELIVERKYDTNVSQTGEREKENAKGPQGQRRPANVIGNAVQIATGEEQDTRLYQTAKRNSGLAGAKARANSLSPERRSEIAKIAAQARHKG